MSIFVSIASYRDPLLFFTLENCFARADAPEKLVFAVVDQGDEDQRQKIKALPFHRQIRYVHLHLHDTLGVCWARNVAFSLYNGEDHLLQIDSHTLFEKGWDRVLYKQYEELKQQSEKPILSTYPYRFTCDERGKPSYQKYSAETVLVLRPQTETALTEDNAVLRFRAKHLFTKSPVLGCHLAAGFIFTCGSFVEEIPYDPYLYFHGEEQSLAIRSFTRGWDIYHPCRIPLYHYYKERDTSHETHHWHERTSGTRCITYTTLNNRAYARVKRLLYGDGLRGSAFGLGSQRSLEDFKKLSGIDYEGRTIATPGYLAGRLQ
jgi:glycosyltransferase involved in cell wall biosynthesis